MKYKLTLALLFAFTICFGISVKTFAADFAVTKIGSLDLAGKKYSEWWYTATKPTIFGTSEASDEITITVGTTEYEGTTDVSGSWAVSLPLESGDYDVTVTNGTDFYSFKLHLGQNFPGAGTTTQTTSSTSSAVPDTGLNQTSAILLGTGVSLLALYLYFAESNKKHTVFEREIVGD